MKVLKFIFYRVFGLGSIFFTFWFPVICWQQTLFGLTFAACMVGLYHMRCRLERELLP